MLSDIAIAQAARMQPITEIAAKVGLTQDDIIPYGKYKAKVDHKLIHRSHTGWLHPLYPKPFWFQRQNNTKKQESKAKGKRNHTTSSGLLCQPYCNFWIAVI